MMDFIMVPLIMAIITWGVYKLFELFVRKRERLAIIEKLNEHFTGSVELKNFSLPNYSQPGFSFSALKAGCLLSGIGLGLFIAFLICVAYIPEYTLGGGHSNFGIRQISGIVYGACVLFLGGAGLIAAFVIEMKMSKKN